jgi:hypothetical protein
VVDVMGLGFLPSDPVMLGALAFGTVVVLALVWSALLGWLRAMVVRLTLHHLAYSALGSVGTMAFERVAPDQYEFLMDVLGSLVGLYVGVPTGALLDGVAALGAATFARPVQLLVEAAAVTLG